MKSNVALICVDLQNDFMPGGSLAVNDGDQIIPLINSMLPLFKTVIFTKDWHPADHSSFASQHEGKQPFSELNGNVLWPDHCVQNTPGADLHQGIQYGQIFGDFYIFKKGDDKSHESYSGFDSSDDDIKLGDFLREKGIDTVYVCGLATDYCCKFTALDAYRESFATFFIIDAMKGINPDNGITWADVQDNGISLIVSTDVIAPV
jgi:nicotinamidase/pyrazinamidase